MHKSITVERIMEACLRRESTLDNPGFCISCGEEATNCEPDAEKYKCEYCGRSQVYGAEQLLLFL